MTGRDPISGPGVTDREFGEMILGIDLASGPDRTVEAVVRKLPDGSFIVDQIYSYAQTIDANPVKILDAHGEGSKENG